MKLIKSCVGLLLITLAITANAQWSLTGNTSTNPSANFLGTTDDQPLLFKTNSQERMRITETGHLLLGTSTSSGAKFVIEGGGLPTTGGGLHMSSLMSAGRLTSDGSGNTAMINTFLDLSTLEISVGTTSSKVTGIVLGAGNSTAESATIQNTIKFTTSSTERMRLHSNGNLVIGSTVNPGGRLVVIGGALPSPTSYNAGINFLTGTAGRLITNDPAGVTGVINTILDGSAMEISTGTASGYISGITMNALSSNATSGGSTAPGTVRLWTVGTERMRVTSTGNVGIGTTAPENAENWDRVLDVKGANHAKSIVTSSAVQTGIFAHNSGIYGSQAGGAGLVGTTSNHPLSIVTNKLTRINIAASGNVGIGMNNAWHKLTVIGLTSTVSNTYGFSHYNNNTGNSGILATKVSGNDFLLTTLKVGITSEPNFLLGTGETERMRITSTGEVAIGVTCVPSGYKLAVKGNIICEKLKVKPEGGNCWADYVFAPEYKLLQLNEVEAFIKQNQHLPGVPSASEVNQQGIEVAEMDATLLKKIEELTLYVIELQKQVDELKKNQR